MKKLSKRQLIILIIILIAVASIIGTLLLTTKKSASKKEEVSVNIKKSLEIEVYSELPSIEDFTKKKGKISFENVPIEETKCEENDKDCKVTKLVSTIGEYEVVITIKDKNYKAKLKVIDKTEPTLKIKELTITEGDPYTVDSFVEEKSDNSKRDVKVKFENENMENIKEVGEHVIKLVAEDDSGNIIKAETKLIINKKEEVTVSDTNTGSSNSSGNSTANKTFTMVGGPAAPVAGCSINSPYTGLYVDGTYSADYRKWIEEQNRVIIYIGDNNDHLLSGGGRSAHAAGFGEGVYDSCGNEVGYLFPVDAEYYSTGTAHYDENGNLVIDEEGIEYSMSYYLDHTGMLVATRNPNGINFQPSGYRWK